MRGDGIKLIIGNEDMNDIVKTIEALENSSILLKGVTKTIENETNMEISEYYINEPRFNGVYSRNNLPNKIKKGAYVINLDEYKIIGTHWIALFVKPKYVVYFDSFGVEHIPKEIEHVVGNKDFKANIFRLQA